MIAPRLCDILSCHPAAKKPDPPAAPVAPLQEPLHANASLLPVVSAPTARTVDIWEGLTRASNIVSEARNATESAAGKPSPYVSTNAEFPRSADKRASKLFSDDIFMASEMYSWSRADAAAVEEEEEEEEYFRQSLNSIVSADKMLQPIEEDEEADMVVRARNTSTATATWGSSNQSHVEWSGMQLNTVAIRKRAPIEPFPAPAMGDLNLGNPVVPNYRGWGRH